MKRPHLVSPNAKCRVLGCYAHVPPWGGYPGMLQSHCPRCGMITWWAADFCEDFTTPNYPESDWLYRVIEWFQKRLFKKQPSHPGSRRIP